MVATGTWRPRGHPPPRGRPRPEGRPHPGDSLPATIARENVTYRLQVAQAPDEHPAQPLPPVDLLEPSALLEKLAKSEMARLVSSPPHWGHATGASALDMGRNRSNLISQCGQQYSYRGILVTSASLGYSTRQFYPVLGRRSKWRMWKNAANSRFRCNSGAVV